MGYYEGITVEDWIIVVQSLNGKCSKLCFKCKRTWREIGSGKVHMKINEEKGRRSCDMIHVFNCDQCENQ